MEKVHDVSRRHGIPPEPIITTENWVRQVSALDVLLTSRCQNSQPALCSSGSLSSFNDLIHPLTTADADTDNRIWDLFQTHEHYVWHSARPRAKQATIELRASCQQPGQDHMVASALSLGLVEAHVEVLHVLSGDGGLSGLPHVWDHLIGLHTKAVQRGLEDDSVATMCHLLLEACEEGLVRRGLGEEVYLEPLWHRLRVRQNPSQKSRSLFQSYTNDTPGHTREQDRGLQQVIEAAQIHQP